MIYTIVRSWDDYEPVILGRVKPTMTESLVMIKKRIEGYWEEFQAQRPNSDTEFIDYLVGTGAFTLVDIDEAVIILE